MASRRRSGVVLRDGASTGSAPPQDKRINLPLSTKARTASTGGSAPASHRRAFAAKASSMNVTNRKDALRDQRAKMLAAAPDRSEERRVGKEWGSTLRSRWSLDH